MEYQIIFHFQPTVIPVGGQPSRLAKLCRIIEAKPTIVNQIEARGVSSCVQVSPQFHAAYSGVQQSKCFLGTTLYLAMAVGAGDFRTLIDSIW